MSFARRELPENVIDDPDLRNSINVFSNRLEAGERLEDLIGSRLEGPAHVFAIPSGGIPVGMEVARHLNSQLRMLPVRKLTIPGNPEAGYGAISLTGKTVFNQRLLRSLALEDEDISRSKEEAREKIERRVEEFELSTDLQDLKGRDVLVVDDGLASGYTMLCAIETVVDQHPESLAVAVPTGSARAVTRLAGNLDLVFCLNVRWGPVFAVADAYQRWHDLSDREVIDLIDGSKMGHV